MTRRYAQGTTVSVERDGTYWVDRKNSNGDRLRVEESDLLNIKGGDLTNSRIQVRWLTGGAAGQLHTMILKNLISKYRCVIGGRE